MRSMRPLAITVDIVSAIVVVSATLCYDEVTSALPTKRANGGAPVSTSKSSGWPFLAEDLKMNVPRCR